MESFKEFINRIDPEGLNGTLQKFLLDHEGMHFKEGVDDTLLYKSLIEVMAMEKEYLVRDNVKLSRLVQELGGNIG